MSGVSSPTSNPYQFALQCQAEAEKLTDPNKQLFLYVQGASRISPLKPGSYEYHESEKTQEFIECAGLWEKAAHLFLSSFVQPQDFGVHAYRLGPIPFPLAYAGTCFMNAGNALLSASRHLKIKHPERDWSVMDEIAMNRFKRALWADEGVGLELEEYSAETNALFQERHAELLYSQRNLLWITKQDETENTQQILGAELKLYAQYTKIAKQNEKEGGKDWRSHMNQARHLMKAAFCYPKDSEDRTKFLLDAEKIAKDIWENCPSCTNYPEFSPDYTSYPERTLLGEIQIALGHCFMDANLDMVAIHE